MRDINFENIEKYFNDYKIYNSVNVVADKHLLEANEIINFSRSCEILHYKSQNLLTTEIFLVVPSIFNSVEILFLNKSKHFIDNLRNIGEVYLIKWQNLENPEFNLNDYAKEVAEITKYLNSKLKRNISLIGHCIGGTLALAALTLAENFVKNLTLLTTPWDFSHFKTTGIFHQNFNLDKKIDELALVPAIYIKILFFLLSPDYFNLKIDKYFKIECEQDKHLFMEIERWLMSGISLPKAIYFQVIHDLMIDNKLAKGQWLIDNSKITIENLVRPTFILIAKNDQLVPKSSILPLCNDIKNVNLIEVNGGHISYLVGPQLGDFFKKYSSWLKGEN